MFIILRTEGQQLRYCGYGVGSDDIFVKGDPGEMKVWVYILAVFSFADNGHQFIAYYVKQGKVVAVARLVMLSL